MADEHIFPFPHHGTLEELRDCASNGHQPCIVCELILARVPEYWLRSEHLNRSVHIKLEHSYREGRSLVMHIGLKRHGHHLVDDVAYLHLIGFSAYDFDLIKDLGDRTDTVHSLALAKHWLDVCNRDHANCHREHGSHSALPTRLVRVLSANSAHLVLASSLDSSIEYLTLSHCWGPDRFPTLIDANLNDMLHNIDLASFPQNFQDAVRITFSLGFDYIWIDSLCIIQDSKEDWAREAGTMARVYQNSTLTIAATAASKAAEGVFRGRPVLDRPILMSQSPFPDISAECLLISSRTASDQRDSIQGSVFRTRGWILQEETLSRRLLHFADGQLFWECEHHSAAELEPAGLERNTMEKPSVKQPFAAALSHPDQSPYRNVSHPWDLTWAVIVRDYTQRSLTHASDKLIALSGIATVMQTKLDGDQYVAGLWKHDLLIGICWAATYEFLKGYQHTRHSDRAPSWSWASLDGPVTMRRFHVGPRDAMHHYAQLIDFNVTTSTPNPLGPIRDGWIKLRSILLPAVVTLRSADDFSLGSRTDYIILEKDVAAEWLLFRWDRCRQEVYMDLRPVALDQSQSFRVLLCPIYCSTTTTVDDYLSSTATYMLLLVETSPIGTPGPSYRRVGLVRVLDLGVAPDPFFEEVFGRQDIVIV